VIGRKEKMKKILTVIIIGLLCLSTYPILAPKLRAESEVLQLPAGAYYANHGQTYATILQNINVANQGQIATVAPGQTITIAYTMQIFCNMGPPPVPGEIRQAFFGYSWASSWPPWDAYAEAYDGTPGLYPGVTKSDSFTLQVPTSPGSYNVWFLGESQYSMQDAIAAHTSPPTAFSHAIIVVTTTNRPSPVGYWKFDEGSGSIAHDSSGNGNDGTVNGASWTGGISNGALQFDGISNFVGIPSSQSLTVSGNQISLELWMRPSVTLEDSLASRINIMDKGDEYGFQMDAGSGIINFYVVFGSGMQPIATATNSWKAGTWYQIVGTYDGANENVYVNGVLENTKPLSGNLRAGGYCPLSIGSYCYGTMNFFNGAIDEVKIYNYARTAGQIQSDYSAFAGPVGNWKFDEGSGSIAHDSSGNGNDGTVLGASWTNGVSSGALQFDGIDDYVGVPSSPSLCVMGNQMSVQLWMKPAVTLDANTPITNILDKGDEYGFQMDQTSSGRIWFFVWLEGAPWQGIQTTTSRWEANSWYLLTGTYDGSSLKLYVNGVLENSRPLSNGLYTSGYPLAIGSYCLGTKNFFNGAMDEVKIYNYARTAGEIQSDYASASGLKRILTVNNAGTFGETLYWYLPDGTPFTLMSFLRDKGFLVDVWTDISNGRALSLDILSSYDVVILPSWFFDVQANLQYQNALLDYVNQGGGLLFAGQSGFAQTLDGSLSFKYVDGGFVDASIVDSSHPIMQGISELPKAGGVFVDWDNVITETPLPSNVAILARTTDSSNRIALIAFEHGNGRVVAGPSDGLLRPYGPTGVDSWSPTSQPVTENKLLINAINWVARSGNLQVSLPWRDDFNYITKEEMKAAGWLLDNEWKINVDSGVVTLDNDGSEGSAVRFLDHFPAGTSDFKVETRSRWVGRSYGHNGNFYVYTQRHSYCWYGDGALAYYGFVRDGVKVLTFGNYAPTLNAWTVFTLEKIGNTFYMYQDGQLTNTYTETDSSPDAITGVHISCGWISTMEYDYISVAASVQPPVNQKPVAVLDVDPDVANIGNDVWLYGTNSYDPDGSVAAFFFDFGDGQNSGWLNYPTVASLHPYSASGEYWTKLKVRDNLGLESDWSTEMKVTVLPPPQLQYDVTVVAHCNTEGVDVSVSIWIDSSGMYYTPHTFTGLSGSHTLTASQYDTSSHSFKQWSTGSTALTITVSSGGTYTAYYEAPPPPRYDVTVEAHCNTEGANVGVSVWLDSSSMYYTPHTYTGLSGAHTLTASQYDTSSHPFKQWSTGSTSLTIPIASGGTYTAYYEAANRPPSTPVLSGPTLCTLYDEHDVYQGPWKYTASASDPDGNKVKILFSWDDSSPDTLSGETDSGQPITVEHRWVELLPTQLQTGMHKVRAKAIDAHGAESGWSSPLEVTVVSYENDHEWGGYMAASLFPVVTISVEGKWVYPNYDGVPWLSSQASWVGIGGNGKTKSLLQAGIMVWNPLGVPMTVPFYMTVNSDGSWTKVCGWEYSLSPPSPGDIIQTEITQVGNNQWQIYVADITKRWTPWMPVVTFQPDTTSAEWIHELVRGPLGVADFDSVTFQEARLTVNGNSYKVGNIAPSQLQSELVLCNVKWDATMVTETSPISNYEAFTIFDTGQRPAASPASTGISLHSSAKLSVWDSEGNHGGYNSTSGLVDMQIPDSYYYEDQDGTEYITLLQTGVYRIDVIGTSSGDFHLHLQVFSGQAEVLDEWINGTTTIGATETHHLYVPTQGTPVIDDTPPTTQLIIGEPKCVAPTRTYVTKDSSFTLTADDGTGSGVAETAYRIFNSTYNSGWTHYATPFNLTSLSDGSYTLAFNSTDNAGNIETTNTISVTLFSWTFVFRDSDGRGTTLKINTQCKLFQFIAPAKDFGVKHDPNMKVLNNYITICYQDNQMSLVAAAVHKYIDSCVATAYDKQTHKFYLLIDQPTRR
jgi:hypothetical protein